VIRSLALSLTAGLALAAASLSGATQSVQTSGAYESFPVVHSEPITIRILSGKSGQPLPHLHLLLIGGYDQRDLHGQLFRAEALTDALGEARLDGQLANLPWLQVWANKKPLCQADPRRASFSVERIRRDGLSTPNRCGVVVVKDAPGVFTVFVQGKEKKAPAKLTKVSAKEPAPALDAALTATSVEENLARQSDGVETSSRPSAPPLASAIVRPPVGRPPVVARVPDASPAEDRAAEFSDGAEPSTQPSGATPVPARPSVVAGIPAVAATAPFGPETLVQPSAAASVRTSNAMEAGSPVSYSPAISVAAALPAPLTKFSAKNGLAAPATEAPSAAASVAPTETRGSVRDRTRQDAWQAEEKSKTHRAKLNSHRTRLSSRRAELVPRRARLDAQRARKLRQKAKPDPASCQPPPPTEKAARAAAWAKTEKSSATSPANTASATVPSKPAAGVKPAAATPGKTSVPSKTANPGSPPKPDKPGVPSKS